MVRKKAICRAANGLFVRNIGYKRAAKGYAQHKFYLGRDEAKAALAGMRLEQLWGQVCRRWEREKDFEVHPTDRAVWDEVTLAVADAIRDGQAAARIPLPLPFSAMVPESPLIAVWLDRLRADITVISIELRDEQAKQRTEEQSQKEARRLIEMGRGMMTKSGGQTLDDALAGYAKWVAAKFVTPDKVPTLWGGTQAQLIAFIRRHLPDCRLAEMDTSRLEEHLDVLRLRPTGDKGKPVSAVYARHCVKLYRHFLRWLNRATEFDWKRPADLDLPRVAVPAGEGDVTRALNRSRVETYTTDELRTLWAYATPFQRLLMLVTLNCGFGKAEVASLQLDEVHLHTKHPHAREAGYSGTDQDGWVLRVRRKSSVYGEWKLWPETVAAVEWWLRQRAGIQIGKGVTTLLVTTKGSRYDAATKSNHGNSRIPNGWSRLTARIREDLPDFRWLSFNKLRKTASNLVRSEAGGEIAGVFLCHGTPVKSDGLLDVYTNRPFAKVFEATDRVGQRLRLLWASVAEPFPETPKQGGLKVSAEVIRRIQTMKRQGAKTGQIAKQLGVSPETVRRWVTRDNAQTAAEDKGPCP